jgi:GTP-binding protein Era
VNGDDRAAHRSGFVALCGRPNVGKSTLLNALVGERVAVATPHPQTTRERLLGVWTQPGFQAVLVDTPGIHRPRSALNRFMVAQALRAARDVDLVLLLADAPALRDAAAASAWQPGAVAREGLVALAELRIPIALVLTKIDLIADRRLLLPITQAWSAEHDFAAVVPLSAETGEGLDVLAREVVARLPEGPQWYDPEQLTDRDLRWHGAELVRAELFDKLRGEVPYRCAVTVERWRERDDRDEVAATVHVEREGQKGIVIGAGARTIKAISIGARERIERLTGRRCDLVLRVAVAPGWTTDPAALAELGYRDRDDVRAGKGRRGGRAAGGDGEGP